MNKRNYLNVLNNPILRVLSILIFVFAASPQHTMGAKDNHSYDGFTELEVMKGERLFKGLLPFRNGFNECTSCHYTKPGDSINWYPAAADLAEKWHEKGGTFLEDVLANPPEAMSKHSIDLTEKEVHLIKAYFTKLEHTGMEKHKVFPMKLLIFLGTGILMLLALVELIFIRKIKIKAIPVLVFVVAMGFHMQIIVEEAQALSRTQNYAPDQPIKFSHQIHVQENQIDCNYCHTGVDNSPSAGIPSNDLCLNCHTVIRNGTNSGKFEIDKIHRAKETGKPVEWIRVHDLPDHVFFSHATHVQNGNLDCAECHGDVEDMHIVKQVEDLSMGWCIDCHRESEVDFEGNQYYQQNFEELHKKLVNKEIDAVTVEMVGGLNCMKCHY